MVFCFLTQKRLIPAQSRISQEDGELITEKTLPRIVTVALIQTVVSDDVAMNMQKTAQKIEEAAQKDAQIICLQELYRTRYFPQHENADAAAQAETIPGPSTELFSTIAKKYGIIIIAPLFERGDDGKLYNTATVIGTNGEVMGKYRKIHIPQDPYFYEKDYFQEGNEPFKVFETPFAKIGVLICYDQWFPEAARICTLMGAEILFYPTAIGYVKGYTSADGDWHDAWRTVQRGHAIANGVHVAAVNRVGEEVELEFWGGSFVCDAFGKVLAEASTTEEEIVIVKVNLSMNKMIQDGWGFLRNRRPDTYQALTKKVRLHENE